MVKNRSSGEVSPGRFPRMLPAELGDMVGRTEPGAPSGIVVRRFYEPDPDREAAALVFLLTRQIPSLTPTTEDVPPGNEALVRQSQGQCEETGEPASQNDHRPAATRRSPCPSNPDGRSRDVRPKPASKASK